MPRTAGQVRDLTSENILEHLEPGWSDLYWSLVLSFLRLHLLQNVAKYGWISGDLRIPLIPVPSV